MTPCPHCGAAVAPGQRFCRDCGGALTLTEPISQPAGGGVTGSVATADMTGRSCPYCRFPLKEGLPIQECGFCRTVHHSECWEENGGCSVTGCAGGPTQATQATQATQVHAAAPSRPPVPPAPPSPIVPPGTPIGAGGPGKQIPVALAATLAGVLAILGAGVALALRSGGSNTPSVNAPPAAAQTTTTEAAPPSNTTPETTPREAETPSTEARPDPNTAETTPAPNPPANSPTTQTNEAPLAAVNEHWHDIQTGDYQGAWADESPGLRGDESSWVHAQESSGVESVDYQFEQGSSSGEEVIVNVVNLRTVGRQNGCQRWTGSYGLLDEDGTWRIARAMLESHHC